ncbi:hypothetical protein KSF78_0006544 [Schistosoma japonicum]|nr:hypothetical protein KSF78_0006544 [Schistosoma japonicum]
MLRIVHCTDFDCYISCCSCKITYYSWQKEYHLFLLYVQNILKSFVFSAINKLYSQNHVAQKI